MVSVHIKRVIAMSGSAVADWASIDDAIFVRNISRLYGEQIGCWATDSWKLVECLKRYVWKSYLNVVLRCGEHFEALQRV